MSDTDHIPCVRHRRFTVCNALDDFDDDELVQVCPRCNKFSVICCDHVDDDDEPDCHYYTIVYTDGSTLRNGRDQPSSGLGIALGPSSSDQHSIPVTNDIDPNGRRSNQRAELLAAIQGVKLGDMNDDECPEKRYLVIATDSKYVVKGITSWFRDWKKNEWRTSEGKRPKNLDLFRELHREIKRREREEGIKLAFWHIPRERNRIADSLAREGARRVTRVGH